MHGTYAIDVHPAVNSSVTTSKSGCWSKKKILKYIGPPQEGCWCIPY